MRTNSVALVVFVGTTIVSCASNQDEFLEACEKVLSTRLVSPSSYELIRIDRFITSDASLEQLMNWDHRPEQRDQFLAFIRDGSLPVSKQRLEHVFDDAAESVMRLNKNTFDLMKREYKGFALGKYTYIDLTFSYEFQSIFGSTIRGTSDCTFVHRSDLSLGAALEKNISSIFLDGRTELEWLLKRNSRK